MKFTDFMIHIYNLKYNQQPNLRKHQKYPGYVIFKCTLIKNYTNFH